MLEIEKLNVAYGGTQVLYDVSLSVPAGKIICLMGRNGVGKTTLIKSVIGTLRPRSGSINYNGQEITQWPSHKRASAGIGYVPQGRGIFPYLTVRENLLLGLEASKDNKKAALEREEEMYHLFPVIKIMSRRMAGTLSGGQQQQLSIARALMSRPQLLLLDEPTEGIQPSIVLEIEQVLLKLQEQEQITILLIEQFLDFATSVANYCYILEKGAIVSQSTPQALTDSAIKEYLSV